MGGSERWKWLCLWLQEELGVVAGVIVVGIDFGLVSVFGGDLN
jgi:hypothetical protein